MAYYADEEDQIQDLQEMPLEHQMEERLVEPLGHHVQDSVNWALMKALKPFTQPLTNFDSRELLGEGSQPACSHPYDPMEVPNLQLQRSGGSSSAEILVQMAASVLCDNEYGRVAPREAASTFRMPSQPQVDSHEHSSSTSESEGSQKDSPLLKKKGKSHHLSSDIPAPGGQNLLFTPEDIIHHCSME
ncbi:hypothetical protein NDU88_007278 [Pleurodeles waltl]|uniref:Uncharacterized protein n=1 Tax=Pleurodeles waltl TaxID=8319 RepID=A0AAV7RPN9_PLEWA|nr:hypothetical protein NDU88_007278 [Pleurodeles waltl]